MYEFTRVKKVTDPFDDRVKARIVGSSGSEHSAQADDDVTSPSLSELFFGFAAADGGGEELLLPEVDDDESDCGADLAVCGLSSGNVDLVRPIVVDRTDEFQNVLTARVLQAVEVFSCVRSDRQIMRRNVMAFLRDCGYNAAVCKTKWPSCGGLTAGNYEFVDVVRDGGGSSPERYFVDLDFAAEFEIARPTSGYERMVQYLPRVFVGKSEDLKTILKAVSAAAKRSMKTGGLHLPPWRKHRFMQNKWFGPYRRTTNVFPAVASLTNAAIKCRAVGFDAAAVNGGGLLFCPAAARTR